MQSIIINLRVFNFYSYIKILLVINYSYFTILKLPILLSRHDLFILC